MIETEIPHLRRYARALFNGDREQADDLVQDALELAWRKRHLWRPTGRLRSWLFRLVYRRFLDAQPKLRKRNNKLVELDHVREAAMSEAPSGARELRCRDVLAAIDGLPKKQRAILLLMALEAPDYREGAHMLGIKVGTFRSRLSRARRQLDKALQQADSIQTMRDYDEQDHSRKHRI